MMKELKKMLKPDIRKIILFLILFLMLPIHTVGLVGPPSDMYFWLGGGQLILGLIQTGTRIFTNLDIAFSLIMIVLAYVISCLLIFSYDRWKK